MIVTLVLGKVNKHLVQRGLGDRVVLYSEEVFVFGEDAEDVSEGGDR